MNTATLSSHRPPPSVERLDKLHATSISRQDDKKLHYRKLARQQQTVPGCGGIAAATQARPPSVVVSF